MFVRINGEKREIPEGTTVEALLRSLDLFDRPVAVERNGSVVPRALWCETTLQPGDRIEIVSFLGGG